MLHSRWQPAVSDNLISVNSNLNGCYAVAAASGPAGAYSTDVLYGTPVLRQDGLHVGLASTIISFDALSMEKRGEAKPTAASRSQAPTGLRKRRRIEG